MIEILLFFVYFDNQSFLTLQGKTWVFFAHFRPLTKKIFLPEGLKID